MANQPRDPRQIYDWDNPFPSYRGSDPRLDDRTGVGPGSPGGYRARPPRIGRQDRYGIRHGGDPQAWKNSPEYAYFRKLAGYENGSYRNYWYIADPRRGHITAIGLAGQLIVIDPSSETIVVKFSSHATPASDQYDIEYTGAIAIVDALSGRSS